MSIGSTQNFVIAQGFRQIGAQWGLIGHDGSLRLFAQLSADPDCSTTRPNDAYRALLSSLQPGWTLRWLQIFWPDAVPRKKFFEHAKCWRKMDGEGVGEGQDLLHQGLLLFVQESPLPFVRRTILEFVSPGQEGQSWWNGLPGLLETYGVNVAPLTRDEIQILAGWIFEPDLEKEAGL